MRGTKKYTEGKPMVSFGLGFGHFLNVDYVGNESLIKFLVSVTRYKSIFLQMTIVNLPGLSKA